MTFDDFIGNKKITQTLRTAIAANRIANAYLFAGPEGIGKRTLAFLCAGMLLCRGTGEKPCGECNSCAKIESVRDGEGFHPDLHVIEPEGTFIKVNRIREEVVAQTQLQPHESSHQVFIIDPAESMHPSAANAFLKTLEEAPGHSAFFLISISPDSLLPTIKSRCQRYNFQRVPAEALTSELAAARDLSESEAELLSALSRGAPGAAMSLDLEEFKAERELALDFIRLALAEGTVDKIFALSARLNKESDRFQTRFDLIFTLLRDLMLLASVGSAADIVNVDIHQQLLDIARNRSPRRLSRLLSSLADLREPLVRNVRVDSVSEYAMLSGRRLFRSQA